MAGPAKKRAAKENLTGAGAGTDESKDSSARHQQQTDSSSSSAQSGRTPLSVPRFDGTGDDDPLAHLPRYTRVEGLGLRDFAKATGIDVPKGCPRPSKPCSLGTEVAVKLNMFNVQSFPTKPIYQFAVRMDFVKPGNGEVKRGAMLKVWNSDSVQKKIGKGWLWDGNKVAWSMSKAGLSAENKEFTLTVDLNTEQGRRSSDRNTFAVTIKLAAVVNFTMLNNWLSRRTDFSDECITALSFFDHLIREGPSMKLIPVKKSYFHRADRRTELMGSRGPSGVEAMKGVFSSVRPISSPAGPCLALNVDVANCCFFMDGSLKDLVRKFLGHSTDAELSADYIKWAKPLTKDTAMKWKESRFRQQLKRFSKVKITYTHQRLRPGQNAPEVYCIDSFLREDPTEFTFDVEEKDEAGNLLSRTKTTVAAYFKKKYNWQPTVPLPVVKTTKGDVVPMEVCSVVSNQRYPFKLDDKQTSDMIKFAVTLPDVRWKAIEYGLKMLNWKEDIYLKNYGLNITTTPTQVKGRLLVSPSVHFRPIKEWDPKIKAALSSGKDPRSKGPQELVPSHRAQTGRWDLMGVQFMLPNKTPLKSWGVMVVDDGRGACISQQTCTQFFQQFVTSYRNHGGLVANPAPLMMRGTSRDGGEMITQIWNAVGQKLGWPQLLIFIIPFKGSDLYKRIKKSCDCRYGVVSQVLLSAQVEKISAQYISNVLMKVNAKLGGATSKAVGNVLPKLNPKFGKPGQFTAIVGADVSHPAPGSPAGSLAAITLSMDQDFMRYNVRVATNGNRVEVIAASNIKLLKPMLETWMGNHQGRVPDRILYLRDGVAEGQYAHVLQYEVRHMKSVLEGIAPNFHPNFTVVIAAKRHHIRFFPVQGDKNGNPKPGTLVEVGCTHPFEFDWYLCAHSAIKGTARPVHYHVLLNENNAFGAEELQQMIFEHSFQYCRSTTPVSQHPAVYYAHLASNRAVAHLNMQSVSSGKKEQIKDARRGDLVSQAGSVHSSKDNASTVKLPAEMPPLIPMTDKLGIHNVMWFV